MSERLCGAKAKSTGQPCRAPAMQNGRCRVHGGASLPAGPTHPRYETGRYSKALEGELIATLYETARNDPKLLSLREDIAVLSAKQHETLTRLGTGESRDAWDAVAEAFLAFRDAYARGADGDCETALGTMQHVIEGGMSDDSIWEEYLERAEAIRKLVDTERKYEEGLRLYIPLDRANAIFGVWLSVIRQVIPQEYIGKLHEEIRKIRPDMPFNGGNAKPSRN